MKMLSGTVNLRDRLVSVRRKSLTDAALLTKVREILDANEAERSRIRKNVSTPGDSDWNAFVFDLLETERIFHLDNIRSICIDYRLRFLDSSLFKNDIPEEAVTEIRQLENDHELRLSGFKIVAPTKVFKLLNYNDPMLFAPLGNDYYYLIHQWGNDMNASRKWLVWPFRNIGTFTLLCLAISLFLTWLIPVSKLSHGVPMASVIVFLFAFKTVFAIMMYGFFMGGRKFNSGMWDSRFYNN
jgi:ABC-type multidrug transport system fused ATPase/permease subunit